MIVYKITNKIDGKLYVGITRHTIEHRREQHKSPRSFCRYLKNAIEKHGSANFTIEQIDTATSFEELQNKEQHYIKLLNTLAPNGYNLSTGGKYFQFSDDTKEKMSVSLKNRVANMTEDEREYFGRGVAKYVEEKKRLIIGINIKDGSVKRYNSILATEKDGNTSIYACLAGNSNYGNDHCWFYDEGHSEDHYQELARQKLGCDFGKYSKGKNSWAKTDYDWRIQRMKDGSEHRSHKLVGVHIWSGEAVKFPSFQEAMRQLKASYEQIYDCIHEKTKTGAKYTWFYDENLSDEEYKTKALIRLSRFKTDFLIKMYAQHSETQEIREFQNVKELSKFLNVKVKDIRFHMNKGRLFRGWKVSYDPF